MLKHWSNPPPPPEKTFPPLKRIWVSLPPLKIWARYRPSPSKKKINVVPIFTPNIQFPPKWEFAFSPFSFFKLYIHVLFQYLYYNSFTIYVDWYSWSEHIYFKNTICQYKLHQQICKDKNRSVINSSQQIWILLTSFISPPPHFFLKMLNQWC